MATKTTAIIAVLVVLVIVFAGIAAYFATRAPTTVTKTVEKPVTVTRTVGAATVTKTITVVATQTVVKTVKASPAKPTPTIPPLPKPEEVKGEIDFYTSIPKDIALELAKMFMEKYPNVKVNVYRSGTSKVMAKLLAEIEAGKIIADVVWVADPASINALKAKGVLMRWTPPEAQLIPKELNDPDGYWVAGRVIIQVIAYNTNIVKNPPKRWSDLISEDFVKTLPSEWQKTKWLGMPNPLYSGAVTATVYALSQKYGWDFFKTLKEKGWVMVEKSNGVVLKGILAGKYPIGITLDYMVRGQKAQGAPIDYVFPEDGAVVIPSPIAIMKDTPYPEAAKAFVRFMLSKEVQEFLAKKGIIPARIDVAPPEGAPKLTEIPAIKIDWNELAKALEEVKKKFESIVLSG